MAIQFKHQNEVFSIGDSIRVNYKIIEKDKERFQAFDGIIISLKKNNDVHRITVQKNASNSIRVERVFHYPSPWIQDIKRLRRPKRKIRRSKLYFLRNPKSRKV